VFVAGRTVNFMLKLLGWFAPKLHPCSPQSSSHPHLPPCESEHEPTTTSQARAEVV
jgi:hypothetical protein